MTRQDWLLLVLAAADGKPLSPLQLQKSLFLVGYDLARLVGSDFYTFRPFDYGPFDAAVYRDAWDAIGGDLRAALSSFEAAEPATHEAHSES